MIEGSKKEEEYTNMLNSLFNMTHSDPEDAKKELKQDRLNQQKKGKGCEGKRWELDFQFLLDQMKHPQIGTICREDCPFRQRRSIQMAKEVSREKLKSKLRGRH